MILLSKNLVTIINTLLTDPILCKLIAYNDTDPLAQPNVADPTKSLMFNRVMPYPFDTKIQLDDTIQLRVYYLGGEFTDNHVVDDSRVTFDIVVAKSLWLMNSGQSAIRPYEIMERIISNFYKKSIDTVGVIHFKSFRHISFTSQFDCIQLIADMTTYQ